ncbi:MAG: hypothetical protein IJJ23_04135, partial [Clostridia bacterium]|nr:hypothetical protein [Clostridia bacterium]
MQRIINTVMPKFYFQFLESDEISNAQNVGPAVFHLKIHDAFVVAHMIRDYLHHACLHAVFAFRRGDPEAFR